MKTKLLRRWNFMTVLLFIGGYTYNMSLTQKIRWASSCVLNRRMRKLAYDAYLEFNEYHGDFHYLGYGVGIGIMALQCINKGRMSWKHLHISGESTQRSGTHLKLSSREQYAVKKSDVSQKLEM